MTHKTISEYLKKIGANGGKIAGNKNKQKGKQYFVDIGRKGAQKRWAGHVKKTGYSIIKATLEFTPEEVNKYRERYKRIGKLGKITPLKK